MKTAKITLYKQTILDDVNAVTFKRVDGILAGESEQVKNALSSDSEEHLDKHILHGFLESRDANIRKRLTFCIRKDSEELSVSNMLEIDEPFLLYDLLVPESFDAQRLKVLARKMHIYIVQGIIHDWYAMQNMKGNVSEEDLKDLEAEVVYMLRSSRVKRPLQPFGPRN